MVVTLLYIVAFIWLLINTLAMPPLKGRTQQTPSISILIPMRNEASRISQVMPMLHELRYPSYEVIVYDDQSTDTTYTQLLAYKRGNVHVIKGNTLPSGWRGKPHACMQLAQAAKGDILLFIDADVTMHHDTLTHLVATMQRQQTVALTGFPKFIATSVLEKLYTPLLHFFIHFHLPIVVANYMPRFQAATGASGAFIAVQRDVYMAVGGHERVRNEVIEDVALFRAFKEHKQRAIICRIAQDVSCLMYGTNKATWQGFQKNVFKAFRENYVIGVVVCVLYMLFFIAPFIKGAAIPMLCIIGMKVWSDYRAQQLSWWSFIMPINVMAYCVLLIATMIAHKRGNKTTWKGRIL